MEISAQLYALAALHREKNPRTHGIGDWVGLSVILDIFEGDKNQVYLLKDKN